MHAEFFSHLIKVLDKHTDAASFFFIYNVNPRRVKAELDKCNVNLTEINQFAAKLKLVRDKTHFHIDNKAVYAPNEIWKQANITGNNLNRILECLWIVLNALYHSKYNHEFEQPIYNGSDVKGIVDVLNSNGIQI